MKKHILLFYTVLKYYEKFFQSISSRNLSQLKRLKYNMKIPKLFEKLVFYTCHVLYNIVSSRLVDYWIKKNWNTRSKLDFRKFYHFYHPFFAGSFVYSFRVRKKKQTVRVPIDKVHHKTTGTSILKSRCAQNLKMHTR